MNKLHDIFWGCTLYCTVQGSNAPLTVARVIGIIVVVGGFFLGGGGMSKQNFITEMGIGRLFF